MILKELRKNLNHYKKKFKERNFNLDQKIFTKIDKANRELIKKRIIRTRKKLLSKSKDKLNFEKSKKISEKLIKIIEKQKKYKKN